MSFLVVPLFWSLVILFFPVSVCLVIFSIKHFWFAKNVSPWILCLKSRDRMTITILQLYSLLDEWVLKIADNVSQRRMSLVNAVSTLSKYVICMTLHSLHCQTCWCLPLSNIHQLPANFCTMFESMVLANKMSRGTTTQYSINKTSSDPTPAQVHEQWVTRHSQDCIIPPALQQSSEYSPA